MAGSPEINTSLMKSNILPALNIISDLHLDCQLWAITGGSNIAIRNRTFLANDIDIICDSSVMSEMLELIFDCSYPTEKSTSGNIRSYYFSGEMASVSIEIMSDVENCVLGNWIKNEDWVQQIEKHWCLGEFQLNLMSIKYEKAINKMIGNTRALNRLRTLS